MPMSAVRLRPGVNTQLTLASNEAGVSVSQLVRYQGQLIQKYGGWQKLTATTVGSTVRDLHGWQGLSQTDKHIGIGATASLSVYHSDTQTISDITPQTNTSNPTPSFSVSSGSNVVTIVDANSSASVYDTIYLNTPIAVGGLLLNGAYQVNSVGGSSTYTILAATNATTTASSSGVVPLFTPSSGSAVVNVFLPNHGFTAIAGLFRQFIAPTTVGGLTVQGPYQISSVIDTSSFTITAVNQASSGAARYMNSTSSSAGVAQIVYYIAVGPPPTAGVYGSGLYGAGAYGTGTPVSGGTGTPITATDWTQDNWGEALLACPTGGPIYVWSPNSGFTTATVITQAPFFNGGIFISMPQQILVAWGSVQSTGVQDPLVVRWSDSDDYTTWAVNSQTVAGSFHIPTGSKIVGGLQGPQQGVIWTDIDAWVMSYVGGDVTFNFNRVGAGCGLIGTHGAGVFAGDVYWCGTTNLFKLGGSGVEALSCPVWDFMFQNLSAANQSKIRCAVNSAFNEVAWFFPSADGAGENDSFIKFNVSEGQWDYGTLSRTAWMDVTVFGAPMGADTGGVIYQHETGNDADTTPMNSAFESGWWEISDGNDLAFVDFILPDMRWGLLGGAQTAQVLMTFYSVNYVGDTQISYGPYTVTQATEYIPVRIRGRFMRVRIESQDIGSFWRIGTIRFRWAPAGRR